MESIKPHTTGKYKDTVFRTLFSTKHEAIEMYESVSGKKVREGVSFQTCEINDKSISATNNDIAFLLDDSLVVLVEHQSSWDVNLPMRIFRYFAFILLSIYVNNTSLHKRELVKIPTPEFYMLYNGESEIKSDKLLLSSSFKESAKSPFLELKVKVINVRYGKHSFKESTALGGYSYLVYLIDKGIKQGLKRDDAVVNAMNKCIEEDVLKEFLVKNYGGVIEMFKMEYTTEEIMEVWAEEAEEKGRERGREEGREEGIEIGIVRLYAKTNNINTVLEVYPEYSEQQLKEIFYNHNIIN